jgi:hypothetical protein
MARQAKLRMNRIPGRARCISAALLAQLWRGWADAEAGVGISLVNLDSAAVSIDSLTTTRGSPGGCSLPVVVS